MSLLLRRLVVDFFHNLDLDGSQVLPLHLHLLLLDAERRHRHALVHLRQLRHHRRRTLTTTLPRGQIPWPLSPNQLTPTSHHLLFLLLHGRCRHLVKEAGRRADLLFLFFLLLLLHGRRSRRDLGGEAWRRGVGAGEEGTELGEVAPPRRPLLVELLLVLVLQGLDALLALDGATVVDAPGGGAVRVDGAGHDAPVVDGEGASAAAQVERAPRVDESPRLAVGPVPADLRARFAAGHGGRSTGRPELAGTDVK